MSKSEKRPSAEEYAIHKKSETHKLENPLRDAILGGQDGLVNALGIIMGVIVATPDVKVLITAVLAATFAESLSMGAAVYTSVLSQKDYYLSERKKVAHAIEKFPEMEKEELRHIFAEKGFNGKILEEIVKTISSKKEKWLDTLMSEELRIEPVDTRNVIKSAIIVTIATTIGHLIPLFPFFFVTGHIGLLISVVFSGITLFAVGVYQAVTLVGSWWKSGLRLLILGLGSAFVGYFIAQLFHVTTG